jgi:hypothetical protein
MNWSSVRTVLSNGYAQMWFVVAPGQQPISLDLANVSATDAQITAALYEFPPGVPRPDLAIA